MIDDEENERRDKIVADMIPSHWDQSAYRWAIQLRDLAAALPGVKITGSGTSAETADFSFEADGKSFWVTIQAVGRKS